MPEAGILIAESGATKTQWCWMERSGQKHLFQSKGLNPNTLSQKQIREELSETFSPYGFSLAIKRVVFYGAGMGAASRRNLLKEILRSYFPKSVLEVETDLLGAVRATLRPEGILAILGTGSNVCYHQHSVVVERYGGFGYLIGDEGSGADLGKIFLKKLMLGEFRQEIREQVEHYFGMSLLELVGQTQQGPNVHLKLASKSLLIREMCEYPEIYDMVKERFSIFAELYLKHFSALGTVPLDFVGSVSHYFRDILEEVAKEKNFELSQIIANPIENLFLYHQNNDF